VIKRIARRGGATRISPSTPNSIWRRPDNSPMSRLAVWLFWLIIARLIIPGFFDYGQKVDMIAVARRDAVFNKLTWLLFVAAGACIVFARLSTGQRVLRCTSPWFLALIAFATCSVAWSIDPVASLLRLFHLDVIIIACLSVTIFGWHERRFQEVVRPIITIFLAGSLIFGLVAPDLAIEAPTFPHTEYYWGGLTIGKNALGAIASTGVILWVHGWAAKEVRPLVAACGVALSVTLLVLSRAATYMLASALVCALLILMLRSSRGARRYMPYIIGILVVVTITYGLAVLDVVPGLDAVLTPITALTGRDRSFTNRALIWQITREHISLSPIFGSGYGGFWANVQPGTPAYDFFVPRMFFNPGECHNGYLEIINDLGYLGLLLLFGYLATFLTATLKLLKTNYVQASLYLGLLFQQVLSGLSESNWLWLDAEMFIFTLATICLARHRLEQGSRSAPTPLVPVRPQSKNKSLRPWSPRMGSPRRSNQ
jgi:exopolysaccharide production protein ExoQ